MILCIPYHPLVTDYEKLRLSLRKLGTNPSHTLMVVSLREHEEAAFEFQMGLVDGYQRGSSIVIPDLAEGGVSMSNRMFLAAMKALHDYSPGPEENQRPVMLYFDPAWRPYSPRWLDELQAEYYLSGAPVVFGRFEPKGDGTPVPTGPVAFAKGYPKFSKLLDFLLDSGKHWRDYLAWEIVNAAVKTDAIGYNKAAYIRPSPAEKRNEG